MANSLAFLRHPKVQPEAILQKRAFSMEKLRSKLLDVGVIRPAAGTPGLFQRNKGPIRNIEAPSVEAQARCGAARTK